MWHATYLLNELHFWASDFQWGKLNMENSYKLLPKLYLTLKTAIPIGTNKEFAVEIPDL